MLCGDSGAGGYTRKGVRTEKSVIRIRFSEYKSNFNKTMVCMKKSRAIEEVLLFIYLCSSEFSFLIYSCHFVL